MKNNDNREAVYRFIIEFKRQSGGDSPSLRQICEATGVKSTSNVVAHLYDLELEGHIKRHYRADRMSGIEITGARWVAPGEE
jgi:SOS-response transcriptional repressor LexA